MQWLKSKQRQVLRLICFYRRLDGASSMMKMEKQSMGEMNRITDITRDDIIDGFRLGFPSTGLLCYVTLCWYGRLTPFNFLDALFNLSKLPSYDSRCKNAGEDVIFHTENFYGDYKDDFIFSDERFRLKEADDDLFLKFLCRVFHPQVRNENIDWKSALDHINSLLINDGFELYEESKISGRNIYGYRDLFAGKSLIMDQAQKVKKAFDLPYIHTQIDLMTKNIDTAPYDASGKAKELLESCCKIILSKMDVTPADEWDIATLVKETCSRLKLLPDNIPQDTKARGTITRILGNLANIGQGMAELRNSYGSGHGKDGKFKGLSPRHARLSVGACTTAVISLWETYEERFKEMV
jgi:hypothetical protein